MSADGNGRHDAAVMPGAHWMGALTLGELVMRFVQEKKTHTPEFQALLKFYGRGKLMRLYEQEKLKCGTSGDGR